MNNKIKIIFFIAFACLISWPFNLTAQTEINTTINVKDIFYVNENIEFDYNFLSFEDVKIEYMPSVACEGIPEILRQPMTADIKAGKIFASHYSFGKLSHEFNGQNCRAQIEILQPVNFLEEQKFNIALNKNFSFTLDICADSKCKSRTTVFELGEPVFINFQTEVDSPVVSTLLVYPNKSETKLQLPAKIKLAQTGNYYLRASAEKSGYNKVDVEENFAVIENHVKILSNSDSIFSAWFWRVAGTILVFWALIIVVFLTLKRRRHIK